MMNGSSPAIAADTGRVLGRPVRRRLGLLEVRHVRGRSTRPCPGPTRRTSCARSTAGPPGRRRPGCRGSAGSPARPSPTRAPPSSARARGLAPGRLVHPVRVHPGVDPAAAGGGAVVAFISVNVDSGRPVATSYPLISRSTASALGSSCGPCGRVVPGQVEQRAVAGQRRAGQLLPDHPAQVVEEPQLGAAVGGRVDGLLPPLQQPLGLGERALLLHVRGGRQEEHLGAALLGHDLAGRDLGAVLPERGALDHEQVADHQPVEVGHAQPLGPAVRRTDRRVLAEQEVPLDLAVDHVQDLLVRAVVAGHPGQVAVAEVVVGRGRVTPVRLEQARRERAGVAPEALLPGVPDAVHPVAGTSRARRGAASADSRAAG